MVRTLILNLKKKKKTNVISVKFQIGVSILSSPNCWIEEYKSKRRLKIKMSMQYQFCKFLNLTFYTCREDGVLRELMWSLKRVRSNPVVLECKYE